MGQMGECNGAFITAPSRSADRSYTRHVSQAPQARQPLPTVGGHAHAHDVELDHDSHEHEAHEHDDHEHDDHEHDDHDHSAVTSTAARRVRHLNREFVLVALSGLFTAICVLAGWLGAASTVTIPLFSVAVLAGFVEIVPRGIAGVFRRKSLDINFLITLAVVGAIVLGEWSEAATVVFLFALGEALESATLARTRRAIQGLMAMAPETAQIKSADGAEHTARVEHVAVGSTVVVRPGDRVPLDGIVRAGQSAVDQAPITGESVPVDKSAGDSVFGGTINTTGYLEVTTTKPFAENTLAKIIHLVESAQSEKAPSQRFVEKFARIYTPIVVFIAVVVAFGPPFALGEPVAPWFNRALVMLLIACPCALVLATPVAVVAAIGNASRNGVLIKGGAYLERAGALRAVAFDKTGTLTHGIPTVQSIVPLNGLAEDDVLRLTAAAEARSEHPLAQAIVRAAAQRGLLDDAPVERFLAVTGSGVEATVQGTALMIGRPAWLESLGLVLGDAAAPLAALSHQGHTAIVVARRENGRATVPLAVIGIADELRATAAETVAALRRAGVERVVMLSGDNQTTAEAIAGRAGIHPADVQGGLLPQQKVAAIRELVRQYKYVAMVGDGVNDAPALAAATVGIVMGAGGSDTALETADVALVADDLTRLPWVLDLSRRAAATIKLNVTLALVSKAVVAVLAVLGLANLWMAIATDVGATVLVILNGMRLLGAAPTHAATDVDAARARYGLGKQDPHAGHAH